MLKKILLFLACLIALPASAGVYEDILVAARDNRAEIVIDLLQRGMDPNTSDRAGTTLLMFAVGNGNEQLVEFLLRSRANLRKQNKYGDTAASIAALRGNLPLVQRLVAAGADVAGPGWNPLHYAAFSGHVDIVRFLLANGAALDKPAPNRHTALMLAAKNGHLETVKTLAEAGAGLGPDDGEGNTALDIALKAGNTEIADYLRSKEGSK